MPWNQKEYDAHKNRLPPTWRLCFAPDWGYFVARPGETRGENIRSGEFHRAAKTCVDIFLKGTDAVAVFPEDIFLPTNGDVKYVDPKRIEQFPSATDMSQCPNCGSDCPFDYDSPLFIGMTQPVSSESILAAAGLKPGHTAQDWIEVWSCPCGWRYQMENADG